MSRVSLGFSSPARFAVFVAALLISYSSFSNETASYPKIISKAFVALAAGESGQAWNQLEKHANTFGGDAEFDLLYAEAALETGRFTLAQSATRSLSKLVGADDPAGVKPRLTKLYSKLQSAREKLGRGEAIRKIDLSLVNSSVALNINFNRRRLGLPYVGDVTPWQPKAARAEPPASQLATRANVPEEIPVRYSDALRVARKLMSAGQSQQAYDLLLPYELVGAGEIDYDYILGTAAVDSGHAGQAIFILLRVVNQRPRHAGARIELGRAYYANEDFEDSKKQFEAVLQQNPPPIAKQVSEQYLAVINERLASRLSLLVPYVDFRIGFDTNANGATANSQPFRGLAGVSSSIQNFTLNPQSTEQDSPFASIDTGLSYSRQFYPRWFVKTGGKITARSNSSAHFVDTRVFSAYGSVEKRVGRNFASLGLDVSRAYLGGDFNADLIGLNAIGGNAISKNWSGTYQLRVAKSDYASAQVGKDSDDYTLSTSFIRAWAGPKQLAFSWGVLGQRIDADSAKNSKDLIGLQLGLSMLPVRATLMSISFAYLDAEYDAPTVGTMPRKDDTLVSSIGFTKYSNRDPNLKWLLNFEHNQTNSTLGLFDSDGTQVSMGVRYDFY